MPGWAKVGAIALVVLVAGGAGLVYFGLRSPSTPVDVTEAVDRYREEAKDDAPTPTAPTRAPLPAEGVYVYATEAEARVDVLHGAEHTYPAETTVTIRHTECGFLQRWMPISEHWEENEICVTDAGRERRSHVVHHEFFGMSDEREYRCEPGYVLFPSDPEIGDTWSTSCASGGTTVTGTGEVVGFETKRVDGRTVESVHIRIREHNRGTDEGPSSDDYWMRVTDGLLIERSSSADTSSESPVGTAHFTSRCSMRLVSLAPRS